MKTTSILKTAVRTLLLSCILTACSQKDAYMPKNIVWNGITGTEAACMPLGNGTVAGNVWAENDGIYLYTSRNECFSELGRLLKAGKLKLSVGDGFDSVSFTQTIDFASGRIILADAASEITVFAEYGSPIIWISGKLKEPKTVSIEPQIWRTAPYVPNVNNENTSMYSAAAFKVIPCRESADVTVSEEYYAGFYHHNDSSAFRKTLDNNGLTGEGIADPLIGRTFGILMSSDELSKKGGGLKSNGPVKEFTIKVAVTAYADCPAEEWEEKTAACLAESESFAKAKKNTENYWKDIWNKSYIQIETPDTVTGKRITEAYDCQRWMTLCAGLSEYPIKFNGSIFTVSSSTFTPAKNQNPDYRNWGECFWWQNTRLPYYSMLKTGDWETMKGLFGFYEKLMPIFREQARVYHHAAGATFPETITQYGCFAVSDFGYREPGDTSALFPKTKWVGRIMQGPLDLTHMMIDYARYSGDTKYLAEHAFPMAEEFLEFFIDRNKPDSTGKMRIKNTQSLETYWYGVENDAPTLAGLHAVVRDFRNLPEGCTVPASLEEKISYLEKVLPEMPTEKDTLGMAIYAPAEKYIPETTNFECPGLMTVFPFKLSTFRENTEIGRESFRMRKFVFTQGWGPDGIIAAILGLTDDAKEQIIARIGNTNPAYKFPSFYGPNFDWVPDQDHGGNIMTQLQEMVMQNYEGKIYLLPAFPKDWNVRFRLAAGKGQFVTGAYFSGTWTETPEIDGRQDAERIFPVN